MNLRQIITLVFALVATVFATAQQVNVEFFEKGRGPKCEDHPQYVGTDGNSVFFVENKGWLFKKEYDLVCYNMQMKEKSRVKIADRNDETACYGGYINDTNIDLIVGYISEGLMRVYKKSYSTDNLQRISDSTILAEYKGTKMDKMGFAFAMSPNMKLLAIAYVLAREEQEPDIQVALYSQKLDEYWKMNTTCNLFNNIYVNDSGEVVLYRSNGKDKIAFTAVDGDKEINGMFEINRQSEDNNTLIEKQLLRYGNGKLLLATTYGEETQSMNHSNLLGITCYDIAEKEAETVWHTFNDQEVNRYYNVKDEKKNKYFNMQAMTIEQAIADDEGAYLMLDMRVTLIQNNVKNLIRKGMITVRVDKNGKIEWTHNNRIVLMSDYVNSCLINYRWRPIKNGIMLAYPEHVKNINIPIEKPYKDINVAKDKAIMTVMTLDRKGNEKRSYFDIGRFSPLNAPHYISSSEWMVYLRSKSDGKLAKITIK